jgi:hypothetical protein
MKKLWRKIFPPKGSLTVEQQVRRRTVRSFSIFIVLIICGIYAFKALYHQPQDDGAQKTLRKGLQQNEKIFGSLFSSSKDVKQFPLSAAAKKVRVNGDVGLGNDFDYKSWKLKVVKANGDTLFITLQDLMALPKTDVVFDFKCIEGWSQVTHWAGVRFSDFVQKYHLENEVKENYAGLVTPDGQYYVGIDMPSMLQGQTILCYQMNGQYLPLNQGFPLRLIIPVKYGIKHLKRIGTLFFSNSKPKDFWAERGYDYYSGL